MARNVTRPNKYDDNREVPASELARLLGISATAVRDAAQRGVIERGARGFPMRESISKYCAHLRRLVSERSEGPAATARARLLEEQAEAARIKNAHRRGSLLDADDVLRDWQNICTGIRVMMLSVTTRVQQKVPGVSREVIDAFDDEIRRGLEELADGAEHEPADTPA